MATTPRSAFTPYCLCSPADGGGPAAVSAAFGSQRTTAAGWHRWCASAAVLAIFYVWGGSISCILLIDSICYRFPAAVWQSQSVLLMSQTAGSLRYVTCQTLSSHCFTSRYSCSCPSQDACTGYQIVYNGSRLESFQRYQWRVMVAFGSINSSWSNWSSFVTGIMPGDEHLRPETWVCCNFLMINLFMFDFGVAGGHLVVAWS